MSSRQQIARAVGELRPRAFACRRRRPQILGTQGVQCIAFVDVYAR
jgi:hypothetical protein